MKDRPQQGELIEDTQRTEPNSYTTPRWVKLLGIVGIIVFLLIGIMLLTGDHGPSRHLPSAEPTVSVEHEEQHP